MAEVKLHGKWPSPFNYRVIWALKLKGIPYDYVEEDLENKSPLLLQYNPVHKKIPVLVHGGKPICESMVIIEYIDEMWPEKPLLPSDPYDRAVVRFWIRFAEDKGLVIWKLFYSNGQGQEHKKAMKECVEMLETVEEHGFGLGEKKFFHGEKVGVVDITFGSILYWLDVIEEILGVKLLEPQKFPRLHKWIENFKKVPTLEENLPNREETLVFFKLRREKFLASA
ncbi:probable glutathione S-transferase [Pistacia vera]|uniref:probable glutathione S-transferase n=1 Tax=Pistacia vera TaxID=55513 RepID=UPI0012638048|nr:probable glutathione S-transferase [Pistacia vera]